MTHEISSLMDGELDGPQAEAAIRACCASEEQKRNWYLYHAIGEAMRGQPPARLAVPEATFAALRSEPTVLAPRRPLRGTMTRVALAAAASVATIGVVGWLGSQGDGAPVPAPVPSVASSASTIQPVANTATVEPAAQNLDVRDYLVAHRQVPFAELYRPVSNSTVAR